MNEINELGILKDIVDDYGIFLSGYNVVSCPER